MKLIDGKGKIFGKINAIDLGIIVLVLVLLFGTYYKFFELEKTKTKALETIKYDVEILGCRDFLVNAMKDGDNLYDKVSGNSIGTIVAIKTEPAVQDLQLLDGTYKECEVPNRFNLILTVEAQGSGNKVNAYELIVNSSKSFKTKYANASGRVSKIY